MGDTGHGDFFQAARSWAYKDVPEMTGLRDFTIGSFHAFCPESGVKAQGGVWNVEPGVSALAETGSTSGMKHLG